MHTAYRLSPMLYEPVSFIRAARPVLVFPKSIIPPAGVGIAAPELDFSILPARLTAAGNNTKTKYRGIAHGNL
jgi:hypothetical protein